MADMERDIFCPICTDKLTLKDNDLYCAKGDCGFSQLVQEMIENALTEVDESKLADAVIEGFNYFCPNCRSNLEFMEDAASFICFNCNFKVQSIFAHMLREYHSHK